MQIHITRNGQSFGPYTLDEVNAYLQSGHLTANDMAWFDGAAGWMPLSQVDGVVAPANSPAPPPVPTVPIPTRPPYPGTPYPQSPYPAPQHTPQDYGAPEMEQTIFEITPTLTAEIVGGFFTCGLWLVAKAIANQGIRYKLTTQRLVLTTGLASRRVDEMELFRVKDVTVSQGVLGRMLGFGTVVVHGNDASTPRLSLSPINNPMRVKEQIRDASRASRRTEGVRSIEYGNAG